MATKKLTQDRLKHLIHYDPETGVMTWKFSSRRAIKGNSVGWLEPGGYVRAMVDSKNYTVHRLAYLYMTGSWPKEEVDHINGDGHDNRWANLRPVTPEENRRNMVMPSHNTSGVVGVRFHKKHKKWRAFINVDGRTVTLGQFNSKQEAIRARRSAEKQHGYTDRHGRMAAAMEI